MSDQIESAAAVMVRDYVVLAFLVSLGSLQLATSISEIRGLWLIPHKQTTRILGILLITLGLTYYILSPLYLEGPWAAGTVIDGTSENRAWGTASIEEISGARNVNDIHGGMAGTAYAVYFVFSAVLATIIAAAIAGIRHRYLGPRTTHKAAHSSTDGLDALKHTDPLTTFTTSLTNLRRGLPLDLERMTQTTHRWSIPAILERTFRN